MERFYVKLQMHFHIVCRGRVNQSNNLGFFMCSFIIKDRETFFTPAQRSQIVWKILTRTRFDDGGVDSDKPAVHQV